LFQELSIESDDHESESSRPTTPDDNTARMYRFLSLIAPSVSIRGSTQMTGCTEDYSQVCKALYKVGYHQCGQSNCGNVSKASSLNRIQEFFKDKSKYYLVLLSGHGVTGEGSFCVGEADTNEYIEPNEVFDLWKNSDANQNGIQEYINIQKLLKIK
jgi:hypothetical protein